MVNIEKELKYLISGNDYSILEEYLDRNCCSKFKIRQKNYYIDSEKLILSKNGISSRIREINSEEYEFTIKIKLFNSEDNLHIKKEYNKNLSKDEFTLLKWKKDLFNSKQIKEFIEKCIRNFKIDEEVEVLGVLSTERIIYNLNNKDDNIVLDKSKYLNQIDFEVEIESDKPFEAKQRVSRIFDTLGIKPYSNMDSKTDRFLKVFRSM
jgi:glutathione S-transferase